MGKKGTDGLTPPFVKDALFEIRQAIIFGVTRYNAWEDDYVADYAKDPSHGDFYTNVAFTAKQKDKKNVLHFAQGFLPILIEQLGRDYTNVHIAGPGFINITYDRKRLAKNIRDIIKEKEYWGKRDEYNMRQISIEYSCPNPFKEMHVGHLMNTVIGESLARIKSYSGAKIIRNTYGGDVGPHVAKTLWGLTALKITHPKTPKDLGEAYVRGVQAYESEEQSKKEIDELNRAIYEGKDEALMEQWKEARAVAQNEFNALYERLDVHFDHYIYESEVEKIGVEKVMEGVEKGIFEKSEGAIIYRGEKHNLHTLVFITGLGTPLYTTKDIGLAYYKEALLGNTTYNIIWTGNEQIGHFNVFLKALEELSPRIARKTRHMPNGFLRLKGQGKMSSREGNVLTARDFLAQLSEKAAEKNSDSAVAELVARGALMYTILKSSAGSDVEFDLQSALALDGDSGPYLQYSAVRARSILREAGEEKVTEAYKKLANKNKFRAGEVSWPDTPYMIERLLPRFREMVARADKQNAPHLVAQYLMELAHSFNSLYGSGKIIGGEHELYKLAITQAFVNTMTSGLWLLNIPIPEKM